MKKAALGIIALAMSFVATTARAGGDIRSIDPCDALGTVIPNGTMANPYTAGETAYFRIRLENSNSEESWTDKLANPWVIEYTGVSANPDLQWAINPPKVGVYVSGQLRGATVVNIGSPVEAPWYTDIICSYTVRPGDLALPMTLADSLGREMGDATANDYYLETIPKTASWKLVSYVRESSANWGSVVSTRTCSFRYGTSDFFGKTAITLPETLTWATDYNLVQAGLYLKSVDFASPEYSVSEGRTEKISVNIVGGVNTNGNGTIYAIVKAGGAVSLAEDGTETVTFANTPALEMDGTYQIAKVTIPSGSDATSFSFKVKGETEGGMETVYLSTTKGFAYGDSNDLVTNFVQAVVKCNAPPPPYITVTLDGNEDKTVTSNPDYADYAAKLTVNLSEAHTSDVTVKIKPTMVSGTQTDPLGKYIGMSANNNKTAFLDKTDSVTFTAKDMADGVLTKDLYIYVIGADEDSVKGIKFTAEEVAPYNNNLNKSAILYIDRCKPQIVFPEEDHEYKGLPGGVNAEFTIQISDDYMNMNGKYLVEWQKTGSGTALKYEVSLVNGEAKLNVPYSEGEFTTRFRVQNASGVWSDYRTISVQVNVPKTVTAVVVDPVDMDEYDETLSTVSPKKNLSVRFTLSEPDDANRTLYAFLVPQTEASRTCVDPEVFTKGYAIKGGNNQSTSTAKIKLLDGSDDSLPLLYDVKLRVGPDPASEEVSDYASGDFELWVNNAAPVVTKVTMDGSAPISADKSTFTGKPYATQDKVFTIAVSDVESDLTNNFEMTWTFYDPNGYASEPRSFSNVNPNNVAVTNRFVVPGTNTCIVSLADKDYGETEFTFNVIVLDKPSVVITLPVFDTFDEKAVDRREAYFDVSLSSPSTKDTIVNLECRRIGGTGVMNLATNQVIIRAGYPSQRVYFSELDGTDESMELKGGFDLIATPVDSDGNASVYESAVKRIYVTNMPPEILKPNELDQLQTNTAVSINASFPFNWRVSDVDADLGNELKVTVSASETSFDNYETNTVEGSVLITFTSGGAKTVTLKVEDKDGGVAYATCHYYISPSKTVQILPHGPYSGGALTEISKQYVGANGRGKGKVWSNAKDRKISAFAHKHVYTISDSTADISASGYESGAEDETISPLGNSSPSDGDYYKYDDLYDSFFYAWIICSKEEGADVYTGNPLVAPQTPADGSVAKYLLSLPMELGDDDSNPVFPDKLVEVFFSKEKYLADNMGDMNADGIPDYYAVSSWTALDGTMKTLPEAQTGQAIAGSSDKDGGASGQASSSDLANVAQYNDDGDFLPAAWNSANPLKPQNSNWGPGQPFDALKEIRGIGIGLNELGVSEYELTEAETNALYAACAAAGEPAADYAAATNWAARNSWTPEATSVNGARLNPLRPDTDGDGFDDGWEYYFWYYANIGAMVDGEWSRLDGRRLTNNSLASVAISAEEIAAAFNPNVARDVNALFGVDFDNDGLTDFEEYALGTNPCDCDSDGDGAADLWEVMMGTNPCSADMANPDCDFMARLDYAEDTFTLYTLENGDIYALPSATLSSEAVDASATSQTVFKVEVRAGDATDTYWTASKPAVYELDGKKSLASFVYAYKNISCDGADYLGRQEMLQSGVEVVSVADEAVEMPFAVAVGFNWTNPETKDKEVTKKALKVFNYGGDGVTFVPCTSNMVSYVEIPEGKALVDIRKEATITLIHDQVYNHEGFDPRVAWNIDDNGLLDMRWRKPDSEEEGSFGLAGVPTNTVAYTTSDEFLLVQYRLMTGKIEAGDNANLLQLFRDNTTYPSLPINFTMDKAEYSYKPFTHTNSTIMAYWDSLKPANGGGSGENSADVHGADTDKDGVPDGWELYVGSNPNAKEDGGLHIDSDKLSLAQEFAGVDSCNAYTNRYEGETLVYPEVYTITKNHPGKTDKWWNKFFPTDPNNADTDGDGLDDHQERDKWSGTLPVGYNEYSASFSFIYGDNDEKYSADNKTTCFEGGGLNPCSVDTDCDLLPDAWEYEFAGINWASDNHSIKTPQILSKADEKALTVGLAYFSKTNAGDHIRGGMDGTDSRDASYDYDNDGLANFQEYLVQTLRHLRYDDSLTPLMGVDPVSKQFVRFIPFSAWDGNAFHKKCNESGFTGLGSWQFRKLGYFALPPRKWDPVALNTSGLSSCANYAHSEGAGYRVLLRPSIDVPLIGEVQASGYACTDPRRIDTDNDGMDDYYELFHGLNPLLGTASDPMSLTGTGLRNYEVYDVIAKAYAGKVRYADGSPFSAWKNNWVFDENRASNGQPNFHAIMHPWMMGTMECDADGDGLRNDDESLKMDVAAPRNTHTDPTPLWMTDSTSSRFASFTSQYYSPDPYLSETPDYIQGLTKPDIFQYSKWTDFSNDNRSFSFYSENDQVAPVVLREGAGGMNRNWMFSFEENEGYDTDRDFNRDSAELVKGKGADPTSDPLNYMDPNRRQALYLPGSESAAISYESEARREVGTEPDMLKQFTAECWICPEGPQTNAVVFERVAVYGPSTLSNNLNYVRANIRIGFNGSGKLYGEYEGSVVDSGANRVVCKNEVLADVWTHVALTFDGSTLALYLNGEGAPVVSSINAALSPANGIQGIVQYPDGSTIPYEGYRALPVANVIGARAAANAVRANSTTQWADFSNHFKGWVDEIRVWDGARKAVDISADFKKRYGFDMVSANREEVYKYWKIGANRAGSNGLTLPAELLFHYNFVSLPGGVEKNNVMTVPSGFQVAVLDNVRKPNTGDLDISLDIGWWSGMPVNSKVYSNYAYVPWIPNTVAHLPLFDGSTVDSRYWSATEAGVAVKANGDGYSYANSANPYVGYVYRYDKLNRNIKLSLMAMSNAYSNDLSVVADKYKFQLRSDYVGSTDLVPLGGAFAKRKADFWDNQGAMDAWTLTSANYEIPDAEGHDPNLEGYGIPEWAKKLGIMTVDEYLRLLAAGLLPDATGKNDLDNTFKNVADANNDGLADWWQNLNDLKGIATADTDMDGLADFAEYLISDVFKFANVDPAKTKTDGNEFDYFLKKGKLYLGEMFSDHDFVEDWWEDMYKDAADTAKYDALNDQDGDGWSNYAERRAKTRPDRTANVIIDSDIWPEHPVPRLYVNVHYKRGLTVTAPVVLKAYSKENTAQETASWQLAGADGVSAVFPKVLGRNPGIKQTYYLGRDIIPGTLNVSIANPGLPSDGLVWFNMFTEHSTGKDTADLIVRGTSDKVGSIDYYTGECEIDFAMLPRKLEYNSETGRIIGYATGSWGIDVPSSYFRITYESKRVAGSPWQFMVTDANSGHLREGLNTFEAFVDLDGNGTYTEGEPFGIVRDIDVRWNMCEVDIEVKDPSENLPRFHLGFSDDAATSSRNTSVNVYRHAINSKTENSYGKIVRPHIVSRNIGNRAYIHEGDFLNGGELDVDWDTFKTDVLDSAMVYNGKMNVTSVTYRVEVLSSEQAVSNVFEVTRNFTTSQFVPTPVNVNAVNYGARPVFRWRYDYSASKLPSDWETFTAFSVQVMQGSAVVWSSGVRACPPALHGDSMEWNEFEWEAPICVGELLSANHVFSNTNNYSWKISLHNARYQSATWSDPQPFRMNVYGETEANPTGNGTARFAVKYFGPAKVNTAVSKMNGIVRVEAYANPDFSGEPLGAAFVKDLDSLSNSAHDVNATIIGLKSGAYYVLAYVDSNGNRKRDEFESWGYVCPRGDTAGKGIYEPTSIKVGDGIPVAATLYIEDVDTDQDCLPDVYEYDSASARADFLSAKGPAGNVNNGYIAVNPELATAIGNLIAKDAVPYMLSVGMTSVPSDIVALSLGIDTAENTLEATTLAIKAISLADGAVNLTVGAAANEPDLGTLYVKDNTVTVTVVISYSDSLDGEWNEKDFVKTFEITDGSVGCVLTITKEELEKQCLDTSKGFFKVRLK